jgi:ABC-type branched-subunit amino acid transport system ATPase component/ABC-type branched-subunit amino acid transport system permease subunit
MRMEDQPETTKLDHTEISATHVIDRNSVIDAFTRANAVPGIRLLWTGPGLVALFLLFLNLTLTAESDLIQAATAITYAIAATGLGVALGLGGEYLLGQAAIFAASAYFTSCLMTNAHWSFWSSGAVGVLAAIVVGLLFSVIAVRISRFYFAMIGFFLVALLPDITQIFQSQTGGTAGITIPQLPSLFGHELGAPALLLLASVLLVVTLLLVRNIRMAPLGVYMRRMRDDPFVVALSGKPITRVRMAIYVICCALGGIAGAVYSQLNGFIAPYDFDVTFTLLLFAAVLVGGATSLLGPAIGIGLLYVVPQVLINIEGYSDLVYGATILLAVLLLPGGVEPAVRAGFARLLRRARVVRPVSRSAVGDVASPAHVVELLSQFRGSVSAQAMEVKVAGAQKAFTGVKALDMTDDEAITVVPGEIHLLLGPNGSGKTTLLNCMCGLGRLDSGAVTFGAKDVTNKRPSRIASLGLSRSYQTPRLPDELSPRELLSAAIADMQSVRYVHWLANDWRAARCRRHAESLAGEILGGVGLRDAADDPNMWLTSGQRRILDVLMALTSRAQVVLLDEPAAGLSERDREVLADTVVLLARRGVGFLLVEHDIELGLRIADTVTVMAAGAIIAQGRPEEVREDELVREVLMGPSSG